MLISSIQVKFQGHGPIGLVKNTCCLIPLSHSRLPRLPLVQWRLHIKWSRKTRRSGKILSDAAGKYPPGNEESYPTFYGMFRKSTIQKCLTTGWDMGQFPQRYPKNNIWVTMNYPNQLWLISMNSFQEATGDEQMKRIKHHWLRQRTCLEINTACFSTAALGSWMK